MSNEEMNQNPDMETQQESQFPVQEEKSMGAILGSIIVVIVLLIAAFYFWGNREEAPSAQPESISTDELIESVPEAIDILEEEDVQAEALEDQGTSDELDEIAHDLETTELEDLTKELDLIEEELGL